MKSQHRSRRRGVILSHQGLHKLQNAKSELENAENFGKRYSREELGFRMGLDPDTVAKVFACEVGVDRQTLNYCFQAFNLKLEPSDYQFANPNINSQESYTKTQNYIDLGEAPDVSLFCGRTKEIEILKHWILSEYPTNSATACRLINLLGMGGIGKTWLSVKLAEQIQDQFDFVIWRSLLPDVSINKFLADLINILSDGKETNLPEQLNQRISRLIYYLQQHRCLIILDGADKVLHECATQNITCRDCNWLNYTTTGGYCELFKRVGESKHQSCFILTSRLKSYQITPLEGKTRPVRAFYLKGLQVKEIQEIFSTKGTFKATLDDWNQLIKIYTGNPHILNRIAITIQQLFDGNITEFLQQKITVFGRFVNDLNAEFEDLSDVAKATIKSMVIHHQPISFSELRNKISSSVSSQELLEALEILQARFLIDSKAGMFSLQPMMLEYVKLLQMEKKTTQFQPSVLLEQENQHQLAS